MQGNLHVSFGEDPAAKGRLRDASLAAYSAWCGGHGNVRLAGSEYAPCPYLTREV
jgi:hypothetical protein